MPAKPRLSRIALVICIIFIDATVASPQNADPSPAQPAGDGPSLAVTTQFIQDKTEQWTRISYTEARDDKYFQGTLRYDKAGFTTDKCGLSLVGHRSQAQVDTKEASPDWTAEFTTRLSDVTGVSLGYAERGSESGDPWFQSQYFIYPSTLPFLHIESRGRSFNLPFENDGFADRYARALIHAVALCHGVVLTYEDSAVLANRRIQGDLAAARRREEEAIASAQARKKAEEEAAAKAAADQADQQQADQEQQIATLRSDIKMQEESADSWEQTADNMASNNSSNCTGAMGGICQALGNAGVAKARQEANKARNQADRDREEIARLQGLEVHYQHRDSSYMGNLANAMNQNPGPTIQDTLEQQQSQLNAMAVARQTAQVQNPTSNTTSSGRSVASTPGPPSPAYPVQRASTAPSGLSTTESGAALKPQPTCTDMTNWVKGTVVVASDGFVVGHLTNTSGEVLSVSYAFKVNGVPYSPDAGGGTINPGQTVGGEGGGIWSANADKNPPGIYWYAVLKSDHDAGKPCSYKKW